MIDIGVPRLELCGRDLVVLSKNRIACVVKLHRVSVALWGYAQRRSRIRKVAAIKH